MAPTTRSTHKDLTRKDPTRYDQHREHQMKELRRQREEDKTKEERTIKDEHSSKRYLQHSQIHKADEYVLNYMTLRIVQ